MLSFGVENFRRLRHVDPIKLLPLTLLVGRNSSGKSSYLRALPLLRQSVTTRTNAPILWYGELVDLGSFLGCVSSNDDKKSITFSFSINNLLPNQRRRLYYTPNMRMPSHEAYDVSYSVEIKTIKAHVFVKRIVIEANEPKLSCALEFDETGRVIRIFHGKDDVSKYFEHTNLFISGQSIVPHVYARLKDDTSEFPFHNLAAVLYKEMSSLIKTYTSSISLPEDRLTRITEHSLSVRLDVFSDIEKLRTATKLANWSKFVDRILLERDYEFYHRLKMISDLYISLPLIDQFGEELQTQLSNVLYIGPARARSERYYRFQELAVSEIDPDGKNLPMFLKNLTPSRMSAFSSWVHKLFGFGVSVEPSGGHISIKIEDRGRSINVIDTGYGISQILPVLGQLWWMQTRQREGRKAGATLLIEQPELHLHPAHQALLADAFARAATRERPSSGGLSLVIETHSEALVNRIGELIAAGTLSADDVQILIFEADETEQVTVVKRANYDGDGLLENWPYGFFEPGVL